MARVKYISIDIYRTTLTIFVGDIKELHEFAKKCSQDNPDFDELLDCIEDDLDNNSFEASTYWGSKTRTPVVYLPSLSLKAGSLEVIIHELSHVVFLILGDVGVQVDPDNNEAFAYLLGYLVRQVFTRKGYEKV